MKKIILIPILLLCFCLSSYAQIKPFKIMQELYLGQVPSSVSASDSVLVWNSDKLVRFVPRSEFGGGVSTPTLEQVISASPGTTYLGTGDYTNSIEFNQDRSAFISTGLTKRGGIQTENGNVTLYEIIPTSDTTSVSTNLTFTTPIASVDLKFPAPSIGGLYTLATTSDVSLQRMMSTGQNDGQLPNAVDPDTFFKDRVLLGHDFGAWSYEAGSALSGRNVNSYVTNANQGGGSQIGSVEKFNSESNRLSSFVYSQYGISGIKTELNLPDESPSATIQLKVVSPTEGSGETIYEVKSKSVAGTYEFATTDEITMQKLIDNGGSATKESGFIDLLGGSGAFLKNELDIWNGLSGVDYMSTNFRQGKGSLSMRLYQGISSAVQEISVNETSGIEFLSKGDTFETRIHITPATVNSIINFPAPTVNDTYTLALKPKSYTVATLPTGVIGDEAIVTDALLPTYLGTLTGGGSVTCPVFYNGSDWVSH